MIGPFDFKIWLFVLLIITGCTGEETFIPDPVDPRFPVYSEEGVNKAGGILGDNSWRSRARGLFNDGIGMRIQSIESQKEIIVSITGTYLDESLDLAFTLFGFEINTLEEMKLIEGMSFHLDCITNMVSINPMLPGTGSCSEGEIIFRHIEVESSDEVIVSGTFWFDLEQTDGSLLEMRYGRFDYSLTGNNFF